VSFLSFSAPAVAWSAKSTAQMRIEYRFIGLGYVR
jgi:hypothetical protein